jgi:hypothetical protein
MKNIKRFWTVTINDRPIEQTTNLKHAIEKAQDYAYWLTRPNKDNIYCVAVCLYKAVNTTKQPTRKINDLP